MAKLFLFFSHKLTDEQIKDAKRLGIEEFVYLPGDLQRLFSAIPPDLEDLNEYAKPFIEFLLKNSYPDDYVLAQGDFGLVYKIVEVSKALGLIPIYATTKRVAIERQIDGKSVKVSEFKHIRFRRY